MNNEVKAKWIAALRSGEFKQGQRYLAYENEGSIYHCAIGVLCELAHREGIVSRTIDEHGYYYYDNKGSFPPDRVMEWAGITSFPRINGKAIVFMNDDYGLSFSEIADQIEIGL